MLWGHLSPLRSRMKVDRWIRYANQKLLEDAGKDLGRMLHSIQCYTCGDSRVSAGVVRFGVVRFGTIYIKTIFGVLVILPILSHDSQVPTSAT